MRRLLAAAATALVLVGIVPAVGRAATATFEKPAASSVFGSQVTWTQAFDSPVPLARVEVLLGFPESLGPFVSQVAGATPAGPRELTYSWSLATDGHLVPNTPISARWRLVPADRSLAPFVGPPVTVLYADTRFDWRTLTGTVVRLHWYQGDDAFGQRALAIGEKAVANAATFLGVTEAEPIDFFVYADQAPFLDALGPRSPENLIGESHSEIRTMFALMKPGDVTDPVVGNVIPHELTHLVFDTAARNPYHYPPLWLNEGVAVYESEGYPAWRRAAVEEAARGGHLMPLHALGGRFPSTVDRDLLAYAEGVSAVDFLVRTQGSDALATLIRSYADGVTDDEAFTAAVGVDLAGFEATWLKDVGAAAPVEVGPQPAPAGPVPPGWGADAAPGQPVASPAPGSAGSAGTPFREGWFLLVVALAGLLLGGSIAFVRRRRNRGGAAEPAP